MSSRTTQPGGGPERSRTSRSLIPPSRKETQVHYKTICAQWYRACGPRWVRIVITKCTSGAIPFRVFF
jgi:hypothetical protein